MKVNFKEENMEWICRWQEMVCLFLILQGMCMCMESILGISVPRQFQLLSAAGVVLAAELSARSWRRMLAGIAVLLGALVCLWIKYQEVISTAAKEMANRMLELINHYHRTDFLYWYLEESPEHYGWIALLFVFVFLGIVEGTVLLRSKNCPWHLQVVFVLPILIITAGLSVGKAVSPMGIVLVLTGVLAEKMDIRQRGVVLPAAGIVLSVGISFLISGNQSVLGQVEIWHGNWLNRQLAFEDRMLELLEQVGNISLFSKREKKEYVLSNEEPAITGKKVFQITVDHPIYQSVYIRGFVGGDYEDGSWKGVSRQEFSDWAQQQGGDEQEYSRIIQNFPYELLGYGSEIFYMPVGRFQVSLELEEDRKDYTLMPYFTQIPQQQPVKTDGTLPPQNSTQFEWNSYLKLLDSEVELAGIPVLGAFLTDEGKIENCEIWAQYEKYVQKTYTRLPAEGLTDLKHYAQERRRREEDLYEVQLRRLTERIEAGEVWETTEEEQVLLSGSERKRMTQMIRSMLWENGRYSFDLKPVPKGEDFAEYFFFTQHKGYCVHFAATATLLFRMNDVPARFVTGYLLLPSDFKKNRDGTWTAEITDERAHAWTEVFEHNIGFYPVEATPPSYIGMLEEMETGDDLVKAVQQKEREEDGKTPAADSREQENQQGPVRQQQETEKERAKQSVTGTDGSSTGKSGSSWLWHMVLRISLLLICMAGLYTIIIYYRKSVLKKRRQRITLPDRTQAVREIGKELKRKLRKMGYGRKGEQSDRDYQRMLEKELPEIQWEQAFSIFQKAVFSETGVTEEEYQMIFSLYSNLC
ncbi:MAG: hypothetical protein HFI70_04200 [Lachnospiraceae bacterium]|nr:hypothetical protein [Lachnospiraceae bacterium]